MCFSHNTIVEDLVSISRRYRATINADNPNASNLKQSVMKNPEQEPSTVPTQKTGSTIDVRETVILPNDTAAKEFFRVAMDRLRTVSEWSRTSGNLTAEFQLTDRQGNVVNRTVSKGDYIRIDIHGPANPEGSGYDWVEVEEASLASTPDRDEYSFRVRPVQNPLDSEQDVSHFYSDESTSTFAVVREKNAVTAAVYDRNTKPNTEARTTVGRVRDVLVGAAGIVAFSKAQWENLVHGILNTEQN